VSAFLLNLARRSAGLGPLAGVRPASPAAEPDLALAAQPGSANGRAVPAAGAAPAADSAAPALAPFRPPIAAPPAVVHAPLAPSTAPVVQRMPLPSISTAPVPVAPASAPVAAIAEPAPGPVEPARQSETTAPLADHLATHPATLVDRDVVLSSAPTSVDPDPLVVFVPPPSPDPEPRIVERVMETRVETPPYEIEPRPVAVTIVSSPLPLAPTASAAAAVEAPVERIVHVHIGAIEIHSAGAPTPAVTPPAAVAAAPVLETGFDRFACLRTFAPWER